MMRQDGEPTVEEILESIKKVIARDNRVGAVQERRHRESDGVAESEQVEVGSIHAADDEFAADEILDLTDTADVVVEDPVEAEPPLLAEATQANMRESLAALAMLSEPGARPQIVRSGETSLEGLARELLRPALAEWLDHNLPPLVERMVAAEIARIVGKRG